MNFGRAVLVRHPERDFGSVAVYVSFDFRRRIVVFVQRFAGVVLVYRLPKLYELRISVRKTFVYDVVFKRQTGPLRYSDVESAACFRIIFLLRFILRECVHY
jgi:hypothetical protein